MFHSIVRQLRYPGAICGLSRLRSCIRKCVFPKFILVAPFLLLSLSAARAMYGNRRCLMT